MRQRDRERHREYERKYRETNREKRRASYKRYYEANKERIYGANTQWRTKNAETWRNYRRKRRALQLGAEVGEPYTTLEIAERDGWRCHICGKRVTTKNWSVDHLVPLSYGGADGRTNVALAHRRCNSSRCNRGAAQLLLFG
jgi:5-methylcytosine-specific restriction endonuclease McrA